METWSSRRSLENYPPDILERILQDYDADAISYVHTILEGIRADRYIRCALFFAQGSIAKLKEAAALYDYDSRDLIMAAEYDRQYNHLRDFSKPFGKEEERG